MPRVSAVTALAKSLSDLLARRQAHLDGLAEIDGLFQKFGITVGQAKVGGTGQRPGSASPKPAGKPKRKRGRFAQTAHEFVLALLAGGKSLTTAQVNAAWKQARRGARADTTLMQLTQDKKIKRQKVKGERGSVYALA